MSGGSSVTSMPACAELPGTDAAIPPKDSTEVAVESCQVDEPVLDAEASGDGPGKAAILGHAADEKLPQQEFDVMNFKEHAFATLGPTCHCMSLCYSTYFRRHGTRRMPSLELIKPRL